VMRNILVRVGGLLIEQVDDTLEFTIIDRGRALSATIVCTDDLEELMRIVASTLTIHYEKTQKQLEGCIKEHEKSLEEEKKLRHPNVEFMNRVKENIEKFSKEFSAVQRKTEVIKRLLEVLTWE